MLALQNICNLKTSYRAELIVDLAVHRPVLREDTRVLIVEVLDGARYLGVAPVCALEVFIFWLGEELLVGVN